MTETTPMKPASAQGAVADAFDIRARRMAQMNVDDAAPINVLYAVAGCALAWVREARIIGNVQAGDIVDALRSVLAAAPEPAASPPSPGEPGEGMAEMAEIAQIVSEWRHGPLLSPEALRRIRSALPPPAPVGEAVPVGWAAIYDGDPKMFRRSRDELIANAAPYQAIHPVYFGPAWRHQED